MNPLQGEREKYFSAPLRKRFQERRPGGHRSLLNISVQTAVYCPSTVSFDSCAAGKKCLLPLMGKKPLLRSNTMHNAKARGIISMYAASGNAGVNLH